MAFLIADSMSAGALARSIPFSSAILRNFSVTADTTSRRAPMLILPAIDDTEPIR